MSSKGRVPEPSRFLPIRGCCAGQPRVPKDESACGGRDLDNNLANVLTESFDRCEMNYQNDPADFALVVRRCCLRRRQPCSRLQGKSLWSREESGATCQQKRATQHAECHWNRPLRLSTVFLTGSQWCGEGCRNRIHGLETDTSLCDGDATNSAQPPPAPARYHRWIETFARNQDGDDGHCRQMPPEQKYREQHQHPAGPRAPDCMCQAEADGGVISRDAERRQLFMSIAGIKAALFDR